MLDAVSTARQSFHYSKTPYSVKQHSKMHLTSVVLISLFCSIHAQLFDIPIVDNILDDIGELLDLPVQAAVPFLLPIEDLFGVSF